MSLVAIDTRAPGRRDFATISGVWKILVALAVFAPGFPRLKEWAYAGFFFELSAAAASHAAVGDEVVDIVPPSRFWPWSSRRGPCGRPAAAWLRRNAPRKRLPQ